MPPDDPQSGGPRRPRSTLDQKLEEFLVTQDKERRAGLTLEGVRRELHKGFSELRSEMKGDRETNDSERKETREQLRRHGRRISNIETGNDEPSEYDTGHHRIVDVEARLNARELEEHRDAKKWWMRTAIAWIAAAIGFVLTTIFAAIAASVIGKRIG